MSSMMQMLILLFLFISLQCVTCIQKWDYMVYAQQWAPSVCMDSKISHKHTCKIPENVTTWTVHGLWPTKSGTLGPLNCDPSKKYDPSQVKSLHDKMLKFWPNLYTDEPALQFWQHEWVKHGTCAQSLPALSSEYKYFSKSLEINRKIGLLRNLTNFGIKPTDSKLYEYSDVINAVKKTYGAKPLILCTYDRVTKTQYLLQMEICLDKSFNVIECSHKSHRLRGSRRRGPSPCRSTEPLAYIPIQHPEPSIKVVGNSGTKTNHL